MAPRVTTRLNNFTGFDAGIRNISIGNEVTRGGSNAGRTPGLAFQIFNSFDSAVITHDDL